MKTLFSLVPALAVLFSCSTVDEKRAQQFLPEELKIEGITERYDRLASGLTIHSLTGGTPGKPPLVLLHGYPTNAYLWRGIMEKLSAHFMIYAPDLPGYGYSDKPLDTLYDSEFYNAFLVDYFRAVGIEKAHLGSHDLGGMAALGFINRYPGMVDKFILLDTLPYREYPEGMKKFYTFATSPFFSRLLLFKPLFTSEFFRDNIVFNKEAVPSEVVELYRKAWTKGPGAKKVFSELLNAPPEKITISREELQAISHKTLILWGENDIAIPPETAVRLSSDLKNSHLRIIPECGHFVPEEQPQKAAGYMMEFLLE